MDPGSIIGRVRSGAASIGAGAKKSPKWLVLRLSTITGLSAGFWAMALIASIIGAASAVTVVTVVRSYLTRKRNQAAKVSLSGVSEPDGDEEAKTVTVE
jgi:uncharacterized membrane protein YeaQ/YmgE (transglycosylase-associated protein family)